MKEILYTLERAFDWVRRNRIASSILSYACILGALLTLCGFELLPTLMEKEPEADIATQRIIDITCSAFICGSTLVGLGFAVMCANTIRLPKHLFARIIKLMFLVQTMVATLGNLLYYLARDPLKSFGAQTALNVAFLSPFVWFVMTAISVFMKEKLQKAGEIQSDTE